MNELVRWMKDGEVQNGYVDGATREVVETSAYVPDPVDADQARLAELRAQESLTVLEQAEAVQLMLKLW